MANTMYDVIMELPLLQGVNRAQVSKFLEKTHIEFVNMKAGATVRPAGTIADSLLYVINGQIEARWHNLKGDLSITFRQGHKSLLGATHLFGMSRRESYHVTAITPVSLLRIPKSQYLDLLQTQPIYLLNFLNYLSLRAQKPMELLATTTDGSLLSLLRQWVLAVTPTTATDIQVHVSEAALARFTNEDSDMVRRRLFALQSRGLVELDNDIIAIPSRRALADAFGDSA